MNAPDIVFETHFGEYCIPNRWEHLTPELYLHLCRLLEMYAKGKISYRGLHIAYICASLDLDPKKIKGSSAHENVYLLSEQIDFIFKDRQHINNCFLAQLVPTLQVNGQTYKAYTIQTTFDTLTCSLTAMQFIEAYELIGCTTDKMSLLAAILYHPGTYTSETAHTLADAFADIDPLLLQAICLNFQAFANYLFTRPPFNILYMRKPKDHRPAISIGMAESLYNLSADGLGNVDVIEQMPVIKYLTILRKKLIESVTAMNDAGIDLVEISDKTGLSIKTIKQII
ncbi:hypothetical protein M1P97_19940 [Parabacteroides sp. GYB001]|uniref:hypothetical protein n=1 Tax=Parabacteroides leei TaxID=2939491 RepID=UPI002017CF0A|nr:hypothetical protein [Parabacteroides leei]MCL3853558.1 hypothetical protein [Parabacteroides leei]